MKAHSTLALAVLAALLLGAAAGFGQQSDDASFDAWFEELRARTDRGDESAEAVHAGSLDALPFVRIELKRSQAYDFTQLEIVFEGGERATRRGGMADWPSGTNAPFTAEVPFHEIARLCWLIESLDLPRESTDWSTRVSHGEQRNIAWTARDGRRVELSDYGSACPPAVAALAAAIENTARGLEWTVVPQLTIESVAHACFRITSPSGDRLLVDPFASRVWLGYDYPQGIEADAVLITHPHYDHDGGVSVGRQPPWEEDTRVLREPGTYEVGELAVLGVAGKHADPYGKEFGQTNTIWVIEAAGLRLAHLGDNGPLTFDVVRQLGRVDVMFMPIDGEFHILERHEIEDLLAEVSPRVVVPMHYRHPDLEIDPASPDDLGEIDGWLEGRERVRRLSSNKLEISPESLPQKQQVLVFQHWPDMQAPAR